MMPFMHHIFDPSYAIFLVRLLQIINRQIVQIKIKHSDTLTLELVKTQSF
jgi:hypothetical protein